MMCSHCSRSLLFFNSIVFLPLHQQNFQQFSTRRRVAHCRQFFATKNWLNHPVCATDTNDASDASGGSLLSQEVSGGIRLVAEVWILKMAIEIVDLP